MDTDKGLISSSSSTLPTPPSLPEELQSKITGLVSSSSSTPPTPGLLYRAPPTPPPPPYRAKPLPEKLRSKIIASQKDRECYDGVLRYCYYSHLIEPLRCIDPDDRSSWDYYLRRSFYLFFPNQLCLEPGKKIGGVPVFELYYIQITKLDPVREFSSIFMKATNTDYLPMIIYKKPEDEEITLHEPLPLRNIFRPPSALDDVTIALSNPANGGWAFRWGPPICHPEKYIDFGSRIECFKDNLTESEAAISYELIESAAIAELEITFLTENELPVTVLCGSISVTNNELPHTKRIIRQFTTSSVLETNEPIPVNRSVFGISLGSCLFVNVDLDFADNFAIGPDGSIEHGVHKMRRSIDFLVPRETQSVERTILTKSSFNLKIRVKVSWWDFIR